MIFTGISFYGLNCQDEKGGKRKWGRGEWRSWRKKWIQFEEKRFDVALNDVLLWKFFFSFPFFFLFLFCPTPSPFPLLSTFLACGPDWSSSNAISLVQRLSFGENEGVVKHLGMIYLSLDHSVPTYPYLFSLSLAIEKKFMSIHGKYIIYSLFFRINSAQ